MARRCSLSSPMRKKENKGKLSARSVVLYEYEEGEEIVYVRVSTYQDGQDKVHSPSTVLTLAAPEDLSEPD